MKTLLPTVLAACLSCWCSAASAAVALTTLPDRERVMIRFEDAGQVLVEEARTLTLDKGTNQIGFTWLGVEIDRSSIQLLGVGGVPFTVIRATYPPGQDNSLGWDVSSGAAGAAQVRISYLLQGISRELSYRAVVAEGPDPRLSLRVYQRLNNASGENYDAAALRAAFGDLRDSPLASGEIRQQLSARFLEVPFVKRYTYDPLKGERVMVDYVLKNSVEGKLGKGLMPGAKMRIFQQTGQSEAFLGEDVAKPTPLGEELALHIGDSKDITVRRAQLEVRQEVVQRDNDGHPALWHQLTDLRFEVENFTGDIKSIDLDEHLDGEWDVVNPLQILEKRIAPEKFEEAKGEANPAGVLERKDADTLVVHLSIPPGRRVVFTCTARRLNRH
jgi:hypothetical protein